MAKWLAPIMHQPKTKNICFEKQGVDWCLDLKFHLMFSRKGWGKEKAIPDENFLLGHKNGILLTHVKTERKAMTMAPMTFEMAKLNISLNYHFYYP